MEVIVLIMALFAALLAVDRKRLEEAHPEAKKAGKSPPLERGRFKIKGKHGKWWVHEANAGSRGGHGPGNVSRKHGQVHTLRQAKEWLWCLHNGLNYADVLKAHRNKKQREYNRNRPPRRQRSINRHRREINRYKRRYANTWNEDNELQLWRMERYGSDIHDARCVCNRCSGWGYRGEDY